MRIANYLVSEIGEMTSLEETVLNSMQDKKTTADKVEDIAPQKLTIGQNIADKVAEFGGSWRSACYTKSLAT